MLKKQPKNTMPRIDTIWAFVSVDPDDGNEGVCAFHTGEGWMPMIAADIARLDQIRPIAQKIARDRQQAVKLVRFSQRTEEETLT